jgi:hypothetical protein
VEFQRLPPPPPPRQAVSLAGEAVSLAVPADLAVDAVVQAVGLEAVDAAVGESRRFLAKLARIEELTALN